MSKIKSTIMPISGKLGDVVYNTGKNGHVVKQAPKKGSGKNLSGISKNSDRQGFRNNLSGCINKIVDHYNKRLKDNRLYHRMLSLFRNEPENNRFLLLLQLKGQEINPDYQLEKLIHFELSYTQTNKDLIININTKHHPYEGRYHADCYDYELLLLCWDKSSEPPTVERQLSPWLSIHAGLPELTFTFKKKKHMTHWLLMVRVQLGVKNDYVGNLVTEGMRIMEIGSFDEQEQELMKQKQEEKIAKTMARTKKEVVEEKRVGVVKIH